MFNPRDGSYCCSLMAEWCDHGLWYAVMRKVVILLPMLIVAVDVLLISTLTGVARQGLVHDGGCVVLSKSHTVHQ